MSNYPGIDYGMGETNVDPKTGIRYGVISQHDLAWWHDESEANYGPPTCPKCGNAVEEDSVPPDSSEQTEQDQYCKACDYSFWNDEAGNCEPLSWYIKNDDYHAEQTRDDTDVFVTKSPFYTHAQFCSPCAPGAGHLGNPCEEGPKTYCFGHDWFEGGKAPYPVYRVEDDSPVSPSPR